MNSSWFLEEFGVIPCRDGRDMTVTEEVVRERSKQSGKGLQTGRSYDQEYGNPD